MTHRSHNFNAGPAALPLPVLEQAQAELLDFRGTGMSILEVSHRSSTYETVHDQAVADLKSLLGAGDDWQVLFMGGGAATQFALVPLNLLPSGRYAEYVSTGHWSDAALVEAKRLGDCREIWTSGPEHRAVPKAGDLRPSADAAYLHFTTNNTIFGTQWPANAFPKGSGAPVVADMSSDILSRPVDLAPLSLIYAGAQKNLGPAGVTVLFLRTELLERCRNDIPKIWSFRDVAAKNSLQNTPPCFAIYLVGLVAKHLIAQGGVAKAAERNEAKAKLVYDAIDQSNGFYRGHAEPAARSRMNLTFRLGTEALDAAFAKESSGQGFVGLKGHRAVGGLRASLYNAVSDASVRALVDFMKEFQRKNG